MDVDPQLAFERIAAREDDIETLEYLHASREEYPRLARDNDWIIVDGSDHCEPSPPSCARWGISILAFQDPSRDFSWLCGG